MKKIELVAGDFITRNDAAGSIAVGSRCAVASNGDLVCSYSRQSALGVNDFVPTVSRSTDGGHSWSEQGPLWPHLTPNVSLNGNVSRAPSGEFFLFGIYTPINSPGESFWSEATQGMKQNDIFWSNSTDDGRSWAEPKIIPKPTAGSAEAPGPMCVTRNHRRLACYAPTRTFDPTLDVEQGQIVVVSSDDKGLTWSGQSMIRFKEENSSGSEAWVVELADGRLLGACWHINQREAADYPNAFSVSTDGGDTWAPTRSTGISGQSVGLAALPDGRALLVYNQRQDDTPGVRLAIACPTETNFGIEADELIWRAEAPTRSGTSGAHEDWTDFAFGEPSVTVLNQHELLVTLWCLQPSGGGIRYVRLRMS